MSHYLSILATEYKLLKLNNKDYSQTLKELYYAMLAIERLDLYSEYNERYFEGLGYWYQGVFIRGWIDPENDRNGFFIRDDVTDGFWYNNHNHFGLGENINSYASIFSSMDSPREGISQDNIYHLIEGLALVNKLVDNESVANIPVNFINDYTPNYLQSKGIKTGNIINFSLWTKDLIRRLVRNMQHPSPELEIVTPHIPENPFYCSLQPAQNSIVLFSLGVISFAATSNSASTGSCLTSRWYIENPVRNKLVEEGSGSDFDTYLFYSYGVANSAQNLTGENFNFNNSNGSVQTYVFNNLLQGNIQEAVNSMDDYIQDLTYILSLSIVDGVDLSAITEFDDYKIRTLATTGNIGGSNTYSILRNRREVFVYEHFPLLYLILNGESNGSLNTLNSSNYITDRNFYENLLNTAPCNGTRNYDDNIGGFSSNWSSTSRCVWPENTIDNAVTDGYEEFSGMDYMMLHNLYYLAFLKKDFDNLNFSGNLINQTKKEYAGKIESTNNITGGNIEYNASKVVILKEGFHASNGSIFKAVAKPLSGTYIGTNFSVQTFGDCGQNLKSGDLVSTIISDSCNGFYRPFSKEDYADDIFNSNFSMNVFVFPNPTSGQISIINNLVNSTFKITSITGQLILYGQIDSNKTDLDISTLDNGVYFLNIQSENKFSTVKLILFK